MKTSDLLWGLRIITVIVYGLIVVLPIRAVYIKHEDVSKCLDGIVVLLFLGISLVLIFALIRSMDKRLSALEEKISRMTHNSSRRPPELL